MSEQDWVFFGAMVGLIATGSFLCVICWKHGWYCGCHEGMIVARELFEESKR